MSPSGPLGRLQRLTDDGRQGLLGDAARLVTPVEHWLEDQDVYPPAPEARLPMGGRPEETGWRLTVAVAANVLFGCGGVLAALLLLMGMSPSDPCGPEATCDPEPFSFLVAGSWVGIVSLSGLLVVQLWRWRWRRRQRFAGR